MFLLIGLQMRRCSTASRHEHLPWTQSSGACLAVLRGDDRRAERLDVRRRLDRCACCGRTAWGWRVSPSSSWAGMRGVVTLAAVFLLPAETPERALLALAAFTVVAGTLLMQGLSLPWLVRRLGLPGPDAAEDALQAAGLVTAAARAGLAVLDELADRGRPARGARAAARAGDAAQQPDLGAARPLAVRARAAGGHLPPAAAADAVGRAQLDPRGPRPRRYDDEVLRSALQAIDLEESMLDRIEDAAARIDDELVTPEQRAGDCEHLRDAPAGRRRPTRPSGCEECLRDGTPLGAPAAVPRPAGTSAAATRPSSKHAAAHFARDRASGDALIEPGEAWRWCYVDDCSADSRLLRISAALYARRGCANSSVRPPRIRLAPRRAADPRDRSRPLPTRPSAPWRRLGARAAASDGLSPAAVDVAVQIDEHGPPARPGRPAPSRWCSRCTRHHSTSRRAASPGSSAQPTVAEDEA